MLVLQGSGPSPPSGRVTPPTARLSLRSCRRGLRRRPRLARHSPVCASPEPPPPLPPRPSPEPRPRDPHRPHRLWRGGVGSYKVYGFLTLVFKAGRSATNGKTMEAEGNGWEVVHQQLDISRNERFVLPGVPENEDGATAPAPSSTSEVLLPAPYSDDPLARWQALERQQMEFFGRTFCSARITRRESICSDPERRTARVVLTLTTKGLTYVPGDRLMISPLNMAGEVAAAVSALQRSSKDSVVLNGVWRKHFEDWSASPSDRDAVPASTSVERPGSKSAPPRGNEDRDCVPLDELIKHGSLRPVFCEQAVALRDSLPKGSAQRDYMDSLIDSANWPISTSIEVLLNTLRASGDACILDDATLCMVIPPARQRVYTISSAPPPPAVNHDELPSELHLTVTRRSVSAPDSMVHGVCSGLLNPPVDEKEGETLGAELRVAVQRPLHYELVGAHTPIVMMGAGSGIAPFIGFLQAREQVSVRVGMRTRNVLFFGCRDTQSFLYRQQLHEMLLRDAMDLTIVVAFSREDIRCLCTAEKGIEIVPGRVGKYVSDVVQSSSLGVLVSDAILSTANGGEGAAFYICGSSKFYDTLQAAMDKAIHQCGFDPTVVVRDALSERRLMIEVFGDGLAEESAPRPKPRKQRNRASVSQITFGCLPVEKFSCREIRQSMLMMHSACRPVQGRFWVSLADKVYDLTDILDTHPGGRQIILDYAGDDVTRAFELVSHAANAQVMARIRSCFVGSYRPLNPDGLRKRLEGAQGCPNGHEDLGALCEMMHVMSRLARAFVSFLNLFSIELEATLKMTRSCDSKREKLKVLLIYCERFHRDFYRLLAQHVSEAHELVNVVSHYAPPPAAAPTADARLKALDEWKGLEMAKSLTDVSSYLTALRGILFSSNMDVRFVNSVLKKLKADRKSRVSRVDVNGVSPKTRWQSAFRDVSEAAVASQTSGAAAAHKFQMMVHEVADASRAASVTQSFAALAVHSFANEVKLQHVNWDAHFAILEKFTSTCIDAAHEALIQLSKALNELEVVQSLVPEMTPAELATMQQDWQGTLASTLGLTESLTQVMKHFYGGVAKVCRAQL